MGMCTWSTEQASNDDTIIYNHCNNDKYNHFLTNSATYKTNDMLKNG